MWNTHRAQRLHLFIWIATLGNNAQVNETLGITVELKVTPQAANFIKQILFLAYGKSCVVKILNQTSFHMWWMVRVEVKVSASVGRQTSVASLTSFLMTKTLVPLPRLWLVFSIRY
jgi:hypothetical protein